MDDVIDKAKKIKTLYDETAYLYNSRYAEIQKKKYSLVFPDLLLRLLSLKKPTFLVDIGCGTGMFFEFLLNEFMSRNVQRTLMKFICADISPNMIERVNTLTALTYQKQIYERFLINAEVPPFASHTFKFIFSFTMLQNLSDRMIGLTKLITLLSLGGFGTISILKKAYTEAFMSHALKSLYGVSSRIQKVFANSCEDVILTIAT